MKSKKVLFRCGNLWFHLGWPPIVNAKKAVGVEMHVLSGDEKETLNRDEIFKIVEDEVKKHLMKFKYFNLAIFAHNNVKGDGTMIVAEPKLVPEKSETKREMLRVVGRAMGMKMGQLPDFMAIASEAWMSVVPKKEGQEGQEPFNPPSKDPNRQEILIISAVYFCEDAKDIYFRFTIYDMIRDDKGELTDLKERLIEDKEVTWQRWGNDDHVQDNLLLSMMKGFFNYNDK